MELEKHSGWGGKWVGLADPAEHSAAEIQLPWVWGRAGRRQGPGNCDFPGQLAVPQVGMEYRNKCIFQDMQPQSALHNLGTASFGSRDVLKETVLRNIPGMEPFGGIP